MKALLLAPLLLLCSCLATQAALDTLNLQIGEASEAALHAKNRAEDVNATQADLDEAMANLAKEGEETKAALLAVKDAVIADVESAKGFTGMGGGADGGVIGLGLTALAWWMRDRRYKVREKGGPAPPPTPA